MKKPTEWRTFRGKKVTLQTIDHQHLSNIYWFQRIIWNAPVSELGFVKDELTERFNGQLLPYRPHIDFKMEIDFLREKGMLMPVINESSTMDPHKQEIWFNGSCVGEIITAE